MATSTDNQPQRDPEIASFDGLWGGGYFEGDPLDPHARSHYSAIDQQNGYLQQPSDLPAQQMGCVSALYATYLLTIRNRLPASATVLEIGPGRGGWTKALLTQNPSKIFALDALSAEHNGFYQHVGHDSRVTYVQVDDLECSCVPDRSVDFFFSFGVFCHISRRGTEAYFASIARKMKFGATGFCMISDYEKMGQALGVVVSQEEHDQPEAGRWYHLGRAWFCETLMKYGFEVLDPDIGVLVRDPIVHFRLASTMS